MPVLRPPPPPRPPVLDNPFANAPHGNVYILTGEHRTMFGVHVSTLDVSQSRVFAFRKFDDAACFRSKLVGFHERWGRWPSRVLHRPDELRVLLRHSESAEKKHECRCPTIERTDLEVLIKRLFTNHILLDVVECLEEEHISSTTWSNELPLDIYRDNLAKLFGL